MRRSDNYSAQQPDDISDDESLVGEVDKNAILTLVDELTFEETKKKALSVAHSEDVSAWIAAISAKRGSTPQRLIELQQQLRMPLIEVWIAALLGGFQLEQRGGFYQTEEIWMSDPGLNQ